MALSGYTDTLPDECLLNPAVIYVGTSVWGATRGAPNWDPGVEVAEVEFDGKRTEIKGLARKNKFVSKLTFSILQLGTATEIQRIEPGATTATSTDTNITTVITPKSAGALFAAGDYLTDVRAIWELSDGSTYVAVYLPCARVSKNNINGAADGEAEIPIEIVGVLDMSTANIGDPPYKYEIRSGLPA